LICLFEGEITGYIYSFEKLEVWQLAKDFVIDIYQITKKYPENEKYGLVSQLNRAAVSIASNISEGTSRTSNKDQTHFTQIAYSSLMEVICQLIISKDLGFISEDVYLSLRKKAEKISNKLNSLRKSQLNR